MSDERDRVVERLRAAGGAGLAASELWAGLDGLTRSQRQRLIEALIGEGVVLAEGRTRGRRYRLAQPTAQDSLAPHAIFSPAALAALAAIQRPLTERRLVGYQRALLEAYRPNKTSYLGAELAARLNQLGRRLDSVSPAGTYARLIYQRLLIDLSWASSRLEGNTYSLLDTERLLADGEPADDKSEIETRMLLNHKEAIRFMVEDPASLAADRHTLLNLHALLSYQLLNDPADEGRLRQRPVGIRQSTYTPLAVPSQLQECFELILANARRITDPIECSFFLTLHLAYLQPFTDVNKRTSRLAANIPLIVNNLSPLSFIDVDTEDYIRSMLVFYETLAVEPMRDLFAWAYERSCSRYEAIEGAAPKPDRFRMRWDSIIKEGLGHLIRALTASPAASPERLIDGWLDGQDIPQDAQIGLSALIIADLYQLHEGNYARARVSRAEFERWQQTWRSP